MAQRSLFSYGHQLVVSPGARALSSLLAALIIRARALQCEDPLGIAPFILLLLLLLLLLRNESHF